MRSMTGYGRATAALGSYTLTVQVSSVNRRTLDLSIKLPADWDALEAGLGEAVRRVAARGKVHVSVELTGTAAAGALEWDDAALEATLARLRTTAQAHGVELRLTPELLWQTAMAHRRAVIAPDAEASREIVMTAAGEALAAFAAMRATEGDTLLADFTARLATLRTLVEAIAARAPHVPTAYREALFKRLREAGLEFDLGDERVLREIALFADRCDITEEITRFRSHLEQFETLARSKGEIGRKAEFILQEMGREVNTMGSKANDIEIARAVIELKNELERIREQVANVE